MIGYRPNVGVRHGLLLLVLWSLVGCNSDRGNDHPSSPSTSQPTKSEWFTERAQAAGLDFVHFNGMSGELYDPETIGPGVALFDYDNDGDLDVFSFKETCSAPEDGRPGADPTARGTAPYESLISERSRNTARRHTGTAFH